MESIDDDWESFLQDDYGYDIDDDVQINNRSFETNDKNTHLTDVTNIPKCSDLYISTKTKISYLNKQNIDIKKIFWDIPILDYTTPKNGIIKKGPSATLNLAKVDPKSFLIISVSPLSKS
mgnify:CR=1 FL=1